MSEHPCDGCIYRESLSYNQKAVGYCNYMGRTGHSRLKRYGPRGKHCAAKETMPGTEPETIIDRAGYVFKRRGPKPTLDERLKQICGEHFVPWEGRYRGDGAG